MSKTKEIDWKYIISTIVLTFFISKSVSVEHYNIFAKYFYELGVVTLITVFIIILYKITEDWLK